MTSTPLPDRREAREIPWSGVLAALLVVSVGLNVWLVRSLAQMRASQPAIFRGIAMGTKVAPFSARNVRTGTTDVIRYDNDRRPTVLYVFSPQCRWCVRHLPDIQNLVAQKSDGYHFLGVSLTEKGVLPYVEGHAISFPVYAGLSEETIRSYRLGSTPQTLVISPEGRVVKSWLGTFQGEWRHDVETYFGVSLPVVAG
jgi:peroxiredoxin